MDDGSNLFIFDVFILFISYFCIVLLVIEVLKRIESRAAVRIFSDVKCRHLVVDRGHSLLWSECERTWNAAIRMQKMFKLYRE